MGTNQTKQRETQPPTYQKLQEKLAVLNSLKNNSYFDELERLNSLKEVEITLGESTLLLGQVSAGEKETILSLNDQLAGEYKGALLVHFKKYLLPEISQTKNFFKEEFEKFEDILKTDSKNINFPVQRVAHSAFNTLKGLHDELLELENETILSTASFDTKYSTLKKTQKSAYDTCQNLKAILKKNRRYDFGRKIYDNLAFIVRWLGKQLGLIDPQKSIDIHPRYKRTVKALASVPEGLVKHGLFQTSNQDSDLNLAGSMFSPITPRKGG
ncbi:hypothetical protein WJ883_02980 [Coxiella burnetii]